MRDYLHQSRGRSEAQQFETQAGQSLILRNLCRKALVEQAWRICHHVIGENFLLRGARA